MNSKPTYTAIEICPILNMKYSSVIHLLRINKIKKEDNKYVITDKDLEKLLSRKNQTLKADMFNSNLIYNKKEFDYE